MVRNLIISLLFIIGLSVFFYPIISNWLSTKDHHTAITKHNDALDNMSQAEISKEKQKAQQFNESLTETSIPIEDPFLAGRDTDNAKSYYNVLHIGEVMGSIEIPRLNVNLPIYHGVSDDVLQRGIGHLSNSSFPIGGTNTHTALTGHRGLPSSKLFRDLDKLEIDDVFHIQVLDETLTYKIDDIQIVLPTETSWLEMEENKDYVTLITCEPYMINTHRLLVRGERVSTEEMEHAAEDQDVTALTVDDTSKALTANTKTKSISPVIMILLIFFIVSLSFMIYKERRKKRE